MKEVLGHVVILLQEDDQPCEVLCDVHDPEDLVGLPPPVVLGLGELGLSVVTVDVWPGGVIAGHLHGPGLLDVARTVPRGLAREDILVSLERVGVEDL